jgi:hypothetical protein
MKPMQKALPTKGTEKTSTTLNPYLKGAPTSFPTLEWYLKHETDLSPETKTALLNLKQAEENEARNETN